MRRDRLRAWAGFLPAALLSAGLLTALWLTPSQAYWQGLFEGLALYDLLPLLLLAGAALYTGSGMLGHRLSGRPVDLPSGATATAALFFATALALVTEWSIDWPLPWALLSLLCLLCLLPAAVILVLGTIGYGEWWRRLFNRAVAERLFSRLQPRPGEGSQFQRDLERRRSRTARLWGSPHCLVLLDGNLQLWRNRLAGELADGASEGCWPGYLAASEALDGYLDLDWARPQANPLSGGGELATALPQLKAALLYERINLALWLKADAEPASVGSWIDRFDARAQESPQAWPPCLERIWRLALEGGAAPLDAQLIRTLHAEASNGPTPEGRSRAALTWLALAPGFAPPGLCLDLWLHLSRPAGLPHLLDGDIGREPVALLARRSLIGLYASLAPELEPPWQAPLAGRVAYLQSIERQEAGRWRADQGTLEQEIQRRARATPSWPYPEVWAARPVRALTWAAGALMGAALIIALAAANPGLPWPLIWNSVDSLADRRPFQDYSRFQGVALAGSGDWLALATGDSGLTLINKSSRIPRTDVTGAPVSDVTPGFAEGEFMVLDRDQGIARLRAGAGPPDPWLAAPARPLWPTQRPVSAGDIIAADRDEQGLLLVARGVGAARYGLRQGRDGSTGRTRSWPHSTGLAVEQAAFGADTLWYGLAGGGLGCLERGDLSPRPACGCVTPEIKALEAGYRDGWAAATDIDGRLWLAGDPAQGWSGPFFGDIAGPLPLDSAQEVRRARLGEHLAWLSTERGLFAYDRRQRRIFGVSDITGIRDLFPLRPGADGHPRLLAGGDRGLALVGDDGGQEGCGSPAGPTDRFTTQWLEQGSTGALDLSPDTRFAAARPDSGAAGKPVFLYDLRPGQQATRSGLIPATGWHTLEQGRAPRINAISRAGANLLFLSDRGAFLYDPRTHGYTDVSRAARKDPDDPGAPPEISLVAEFREPGAGHGMVLSLGDTRPLLLDPKQQARVPELGENTWLDLDPVHATEPRQLLPVVGKPLGVGPRGELYLYNALGSGVESVLLGGRVPALTGDRFRGDLQILPSETGTPTPDWQAALVTPDGSQVARYDSRSGTLQATPYGEPAAIRQVRIAGNDLVVQQEDGRLLSLDRQGAVTGRFGGGALPLAPDTVSAIAPFPGEGGAVLVGGPHGYVGRYDWGRGSWERVGGGPPADSRVVGLAGSRFGIFARLEDGRLFRAPTEWNGVARPWSEVSGYRELAHAGDSLWGLKEGAIDRVKANNATPPRRWKQEPFTYADGDMADFVAHARFVWPAGGGRLLFFSADGEAGIYDALPDYWVRRHPPLAEPIGQLAAGPRFAIVLAGNRLLRLDPDLRISRIGRLPPGAEAVYLGFRGNSPLVAFLLDGSVRLWEWPDWQGELPPEKREFTHGLRLPAAQFEIADTVLVGPAGPDRYFFLDGGGRCAFFHPASGNWSQACERPEGGRLAGWLGRPGGAGFELVYAVGGDSGALTRFDEAWQPTTRQAGLGAVSYLEQRRFGWMRHLLNPWSTPSGPAPEETAPPLGTPADGVLADGEELRVERHDGVATVLLRDEGKWRDLLRAPAPDSLLITSRGELWVALGRRLVQLRRDPATAGLVSGPASVPLAEPLRSLTPLPGGDTRFETGTGRSGILDGELKEVAVSTMELGTFEFGAQRRLASWSSDRGFQLQWQADTPVGDLPPVWSGQRLTTQVIHTLGSDGSRLLIGSEAGLIVRDPRDYRVGAFHPGLRVVRIERLYGPDRALLTTAEGDLRLWQDGRITPLTQAQATALETRVETRAWSWSLGPAGASTLSVQRSNAPGRPRRWERLPGGRWRFADDRVNWLGRPAQPGLLLLATGAGLWKFDGRLRTEDPDAAHLEGRSIRRVRLTGSGAWVWQDEEAQWHPVSPAGPADLPPPEGEEYGVDQPMVRIGYAQGEVGFAPFDGGDTFVDGRFFFDLGTSAVAPPGSGLLYTLVPGRALLQRRDPRDPRYRARVFGAWRLPAELAQATRRPGGIALDALSQEATTPIRISLPDGPERMSWRFDPQAPAPEHWSRTEPPPRDIADGGGDGTITWRTTERHAGEYRPYLATAAGLQPIDDWWAGDRFAWDAVHDLCFLDDRTLVLLSRAGPVLYGRKGNGFSMDTLFPHPGLRSCVPARDAGGKRTGLVMTAGADGPDLLLRRGEGGAVRFEPHPRQQTVRLEPQVALARVGTGEAQRLDLVERWVPPGRGGIGSDLAAIPPARVIGGGRFVFDRVTAAARYAPDGSAGQPETWITAASCKGEAHPCVMMKYDLERGGANPGLVLRAIRPAPDGSGVRTSPAGEITLLAGGRLLRTGAWDDPQWRPLARGEDDAAFLTGENLLFDIPSLGIGLEPRYTWNHQPPVRVNPAEFPLFTSVEGGTAFSFDRFTSLASLPDADELYVGTRGGVLRLPYDPAAPPGLPLAGRRGLFHPVPHFSVQDVETGRDGDLWVESASGAGAAPVWSKAQRDGERITWQPRPAGRPAVLVRVGDRCIRVGGTAGACPPESTPLLESNDAWGIHRRPLEGITGYLVDGAAADTVWVATRNEGIFKLRREAE